MRFISRFPSYAGQRLLQLMIQRGWVKPQVDLLAEAEKAEQTRKARQPQRDLAAQLRQELREIYHD